MALSKHISAMGSFLQQLLDRSDYFPIVAGVVDRIGLRVDEVEFMLCFEDKGSGAALRLWDRSIDVNPQLWLTVGSSELRTAIEHRQPLKPAVVTTGPGGHALHPVIERVLLRCLELPPYPLADRTELVYPALFGFGRVQVVWQSQRSRVRVLMFKRGEGDWVCVSDGFSDPGYGNPGKRDRQVSSGLGYELVAECPTRPLLEQFAGWVKYLDDTQNDMLLGNWLEYEGRANIPGTDYAGYLITRPRKWQPYFPVGADRCAWHLLMPVNHQGLQEAKASGVEAVLNRITSKR